MRDDETEDAHRAAYSRGRRNAVLPALPTITIEDYDTCVNTPVDGVIVAVNRVVDCEQAWSNSRVQSDEHVLTVPTPVARIRRQLQ
jgi:hypothetical protein